MEDNDVRMLSLGLMLIVVGLLYLFDIVPAGAQYGGWGIYGPYGQQSQGAYDYPQNYVPPYYQGPRFGPQPGPCVGGGNCGGAPAPQQYAPRFDRYGMPRWNERY